MKRAHQHNFTYLPREKINVVSRLVVIKKKYTRLVEIRKRCN